MFCYLTRLYYQGLELHIFTLLFLDSNLSALYKSIQNTKIKLK